MGERTQIGIKELREQHRTARMFLQTPTIATTRTRLTATKDLAPCFSFLITFLDRFPLIV